MHMKFPGGTRLAATVVLLGFGTACEKKPSPPAASTPASTSSSPRPGAKLPPRQLEVFSRVAKEISKLLNKPVSEITLENEFVRDLGADSLDMVELVMALEETFGVSINDDAAAKMSKVSHVVDYLARAQPASTSLPVKDKNP